MRLGVLWLFASLEVFSKIPDLPDFAKDLIFGFLPGQKMAYLTIIQDRSFDFFLSRIQVYANLQSPDSAINFFWKNNKNEIRECLAAANADLGFSSLRLGSDLTPRRTPSRAVECLRPVCLEFLNLRALLISWINDDSLVLNSLRFDKAYKALGLLASFQPLKGLVFYEAPIKDISGLSRLTTLRWVRFVKSPVKDVAELRKLEQGGLRIY